MSKLPKTPLRYPGGKSRALKYLFPRIPDKIKEYREPFLGGGSMAIEFTKQYPDIPVVVRDLYGNLYSFWITLQKFPYDLKHKIEEEKNQCEKGGVDAYRELNRKCLETIADQSDHFERAWRFWILNKTSFSGLTEGSSFSVQTIHSNFSYKGISNLLKFGDLIENWTILNEDYRELLDAPKDTFIFLDPPYLIESALYGKKGKMHAEFSHEEFLEACNTIKCNAMITYNSCDTLKEWFVGWNQEDWDLTYTMRSDSRYRETDKEKKELLLTNYDTFF